MLAVLELDHLAGLDVDQVVVAAMRGGLVAGPAAAEITAGEDALLLQQAHRAVDGGDGDPSVQGRGTPIEFLHIRMVFRFGQDAGDHAALPGHLETALDTQPFDTGIRPRIQRRHRRERLSHRLFEHRIARR